MAKLPNGLLGAPSGKVGPVVACTWKGQPYLRALPQKPAGQPSEARLQTQSKFSIAHYWLKPLLEVVREGFKNFTPTNFGFNAAKSMLLKNSLVQEGSEFRVDPSKVLISHGELPLSENLEAVLEGNEVVFSWDPAVAKAMNPRDQVMVLAYDPEKGLVQYEVNGNFRMNGSDRLKLWQPGTYHLYAAFLAFDRSRQSQSMYLGSVEIA